MTAAVRLPGESPQEWAARTLTKLGIAKPTPAPAVKAKPKRCIYCGRPASGGLSCHAHSDMPPLDPVLHPDVPQKPEPDAHLLRYWLDRFSMNEIRELAAGLTMFDVPSTAPNATGRTPELRGQEVAA